MRVATIDIGTNSVLLLVAEQKGDVLVPVIERATITRLGEGVDATRSLDPRAVERTLACLAGYAAEIQRSQASRVTAVGTSAMRDARGGEGFVIRAKELLGVAPRVISGTEEAELTFTGALAGLEVAGPVVVFDLGGGSTELIRGTGGRGESMEQAVSLDVGSVRLSERHVCSDPPRAGELEAVRRDAHAALSSLGSAWVSRASGATLVGVAGTVTTLAAYALGVIPYAAARVHGARLSAAEVASSTARLAGMRVEERRRQQAIDPKRADVIVAGGVIVEEILAWAESAELVVSDRGVRWGLAKRLLSHD